MTTQTVELDPATGLPALPEGFFWEIKKSENYPDCNVLIIVREQEIITRKWLGLVTERSTGMVRYSDYGEYIYHPNDVSTAAENIWHSFTYSEGKEQALAALIGVYPPKNLNSL